MPSLCADFVHPFPPYFGVEFFSEFKLYVNIRKLVLQNGFRLCGCKTFSARVAVPCWMSNSKIIQVIWDGILKAPFLKWFGENTYFGRFDGPGSTGFILILTVDRIPELKLNYTFPCRWKHESLAFFVFIRVIKVWLNSDIPYTHKPSFASLKH